MVLDKLIIRDRKLSARKRDAEILAELRKPQEDSEIINQKEFPTLERLPGLKLTGKALADLLMVFEFLHNFGETLGFGEFVTFLLLFGRLFSVSHKFCSCLINRHSHFRYGIVAFITKFASGIDQRRCTRSRRRVVINYITFVGVCN